MRYGWWRAARRWWMCAGRLAWLGSISAVLVPTFKDLTNAVHTWHEEIFAYFEQLVTNLAKDMNRMGGATASR